MYTTKQGLFGSESASLFVIVTLLLFSSVLVFSNSLQVKGNATDLKLLFAAETLVLAIALAQEITFFALDFYNVRSRC